MDLLSLGIILLILAVSGGIAFVADGLGKKIGKKRLSLFGLRPKHVASLGTVAMGVFVSGLTIGFIAAVSRDAREWLVQGRQLLVQRNTLQSNVDAQRTQLGKLNGQLAVEGDQIREVQGKLDAKLDEAKHLDARVKGLDADLREKNGALREAKVELRERQEAIVRLQRQLPELRERVATLQGNAAVANRLLQTVKRSLATVKSALAVAETNLKTANDNAKFATKSANEALTQRLETYKENSLLETEIEDRKKQAEELRAEAATLIAQREAAQAQADVARAQLLSAQEQLDKASAQFGQMQEAFQSFLNNDFKMSRTEAMTFRRGEEVARVVVPAGADVETAVNSLTSLLRLSRIEAAERGAKGHRSGGHNFEAADVMDHKDPKSGEVIEAETLKRAFAASLTGKPEDQVLVATSSFNAFTGEPVSLDLAALPNPVVYRRNDTVAETRIDGGQREDRILAQLSRFMNGDLRDHATQNRMIPRTGTPAPFGEPSAAEVWALLQNVRKAGRTVRIQAVAEDDIRAADPLRVEFRVR